MSNTQVIQEVKLNLGGCLPIGSEITDVQVDCNPVDDQGNPIVDQDGRPIPQLTIVQMDERGNQTTFITDLCPDKYMTVVDNEDGTITATNVDGVEVTWCKEATIAEGVGINFSGAVCDPDDPLVITLALCELDIATQEQVDSAATVLHAGCIDGEQKLFPRQTLCEMLGGLEEGDEIIYDGSQDIGVETVDPGTCETKRLTLGKFPEIPTIPELPCIPISEGMPNYVPADQQSRIVLDCDGCIWYYTCQNGWTKSCGGLPELELLTPEEVDEICTNLRFMVHYQEGDCTNHRDMTLEQIAEWIQGCLCALIAVDENTNAVYALDCVDGVIIKRPIPPICDQLNDLTVATAAVNGADVKLVYIDDNGDCFAGPIEGCCPVIFGSLQGNSGGTCFDVPSGSLLFDSRVNGFHPTPTGPPRPLNFTVTNPTNNVGVVHLWAQGYAARYVPTVGKDAQLFTGLGLKSTTDQVGGVGSGSEPQPHAVTGGMTYEIQDIPSTDRYPWFANFGGHPAFGNGNLRQYTASSLYKQFPINPGETLTFATFFAIGYSGATSGIESFHGGSATSFQFVGYND